MPQRRILIALDGKKHANIAFQWYLDNLSRSGDEVVIFHCSDFTLNVNLPGALANVDKVSKLVVEAKAHSDNIITAAIKTLSDKGIKGYGIAKFSSKPGDEMLTAIEEENVDQVIMGTRDLGAVKRTLIGSISTFIVRHSKVPVTIVKTPH